MQFGPRNSPELTREGRSGSFLLWVILLLHSISGAASASTPSEESEPWPSRPFEASAASIYREAVARSEGADASALMLYQGVEYRFAADGRLEIQRHWIYRVLDDSALDDWSVSQMRWSPWHQERPEIKARVIREGGAEEWLTPDSFEERAAPESADGLSGDRRLLYGRLPGVEAGAVVEESIILRETRAAFPWGTAHRHYTALFIPTVRGRVVLDASTRLALRYGVRKMPGLEPTSTEVKDGRVRVVFDFSDLPPVKPVEDGLPGHRPRYPHIAFSTGRSWNWVATGLGELFEKVVTRTRLDALADELPDATDPLETRLDQILAVVRERIRYNGLELNASPLDPDPDRVLRTGSGDGFDIGLTLVAAFRRVGLQSNVALVSSGFGTDVEPQLPGFGLFNHALVRVTPGPGREPVWIDPVAPYSRPGELPLAAQGRFALIVSPETQKPILTPATRPEDNLARETRRVYFSDFGPGRIIETCEYLGSAERSQRRITAGLEADARRRGYQAYVHAFHHAANLGRLLETDAKDLSGPFVLELEAIDSNRARTDLNHATLEIPVRELARRMPAALLESDQRPRTEEYVFPEPFVTEWIYEIHPPPGFVLLELPPDSKRFLGPAGYQTTFRRERKASGERIIGELRFDVGQRLLSASQFETLRAELQEFLSSPPLILRFDSVAGQSLESGDYADAFQTLQQAVERDPERAGQRVRLSQALLSVGMAQEAEHQARQAVALAPQWGVGYWALARSLEHDSFGRRFSLQAPLQRAADALEEAVRLAPNDPMIRSEYPRLLLRSATGRPGPGAEIDEALAAFQKWRRDFARPDLDEELKTLLSSLRRWPNLEKLLSETEPGSSRHKAAQVKTEGPESISLADTDVEAVVRELVEAREYDSARKLFPRASGAVSKGWAWLNGLTRSEELDLHPEDPQTPVRRLILAVSVEGFSREALVKAFHPRLLAKLDIRDLRKLRDRFDSLVPESARPLNPSRELWADLVMSAFDPKLSGAPHLGYRVDLSGSGAPTDLFFVTASTGELRVTALGTALGEVGAEAMERLELGDLPGAQRWLDWAFETMSTAERDRDGKSDPLGGQPLRYLWRKDFEQPSRDHLRIAAAALSATSDRSGVNLQVLERVTAEDLDFKDKDIADKALIDLALEVGRLQSYSTNAAYVELESSAKDLLSRFPSSPQAYQKLVEALTGLGKWREFVERSQERLKADPDDVDAHRALAHWALRSPDAETADEHFSALQRLGALEAADAATWVFAMATDESRGLEGAWKVLGLTEAKGRHDALWLRAKALLLARQGRAAQARKTLIEAMEIQGADSLTVEDGYLLGRIAEGAGLERVAHDLYATILINPELRDRSPLVYVLTKNALGRLSRFG